MSGEKEIVIVKRRLGGDHDGHHGGAWKIAFADFMTAMMAFFLVLWIVNSTSKETRSSIARYFNPIKLSDTTPARKGLQDPREEDFEAAEQFDKKQKLGAPAVKPVGSASINGPPGKNPIASTAQTAGVAERPPDGRGGEGAGTSQQDLAELMPPETVDDPFRLLRPKIARQAYSEERSEPAPVQEKATEEAKPDTSATRETPNATPGRAQAVSQTGAPSNVDHPLRQAVEALSRQEKIAQRGNSVSVTEVPEGTLISLLDNSITAMFSPGSSKLSAEATASLTRIGKAIREIPNSVIIAGYTDSTGYKKGQGQNFGLSALRAQAAMNVLIQSGLSERRIERIEGHADRQPMVIEDRSNARNRRIDILLRRRDA
jgi:chemotaxis protein MotB